MPVETLETDYLIIGAGAAGMAFADTLLENSAATVTIVDRRHAPGGHWIDAYPYVLLHQPSSFYGVSSVPLGRDAIEISGPNTGYYELAGVDEIRAYFAHVMQHRFLPSGRVRYFPSCDYIAENRITLRLVDHSWDVRVHRKIVDTAYLEGTVPATGQIPFEIADGMQCVAAGDLTRTTKRFERYAIIGAGKTALDACVWLLEQGVPPAMIRWIKPREAWWINRKFQQPHTLLPDFYRGMAIQFEAMAQAASIPDLFTRLEMENFFLRVDQGVTPTMFRGAVVSEKELELLRQVKDVVRLGHVQKIGHDEIVLDEGRVPTSKGTLYVHCASRGLTTRPLRPIFAPEQITIQPFRWGFACYQYAMLGMVKATVQSDEEKNRLCPAIAYWDTDRDCLSSFLATLANERAQAAYPALVSWAKSTRLNSVSQVAGYSSMPAMIESRKRIKRNGAVAATNILGLLKERLQ